MLFNSAGFLVFFAIVVWLYYALPHRYRRWLLLASSYFFYMSWRPAFILLILASTLIDYVCGLQMDRHGEQRRRRMWLALSLFANLGLLFTFKYLNFFAWTVQWFWGTAGDSGVTRVLDVALPVGISFYTFQTLSYTIDVYRRERPAERRLSVFALYVSFFPQLVAGPIERSTKLMPQFDRDVPFQYERVTDGLKLMLWGLFKKMVIADNLALAVNAVYGAPEHFAGPSLVAATLYFAVQIYCDFSGYSDVAIGAAQVLGFRLMDNFNRPYYAKSVGEFWKRWHISLSTWFRDYLYIPLGGNRASIPRWYLNLFVVFVVSGLWHGAKWTFVIWGALHGLYLVAGLICRPALAAAGRAFGLDRHPRAAQYLGLAWTFLLINIAWIFFRADSLSDAWYIVTHLHTGWEVLWSGGFGQTVMVLDQTAPVVAGLGGTVVMEWVHLRQRHGRMRHMLRDWPAWQRWLVYYLLIAAILLCGNFNGQEFIYFQF